MSVTSIADLLRRQEFASVQCKFGKAVRECCAWGQLHWSVAQRLAQAIEEDANAVGNFVHPDVQRIASLGSYGRYSGNVRREALTRFKPLPNLAKPLLARVPIIRTKASNHFAPDFMDLPILLPCDIFESLSRYFPRKFQSLLGNGIQQFWGKVSDDDPRLVNHPVLMIDNWKKKALPLLLHGDGVRFTMKKTASLLFQCLCCSLNDGRLNRFSCCLISLKCVVCIHQCMDLATTHWMLSGPTFATI